MKPRTTKETAMICVAAVLVVTVLTIPFELTSARLPAGAERVTAEDPQGSRVSLQGPCPWHDVRMTESERETGIWLGWQRGQPGRQSAGTLTTMASWVDRAITTTASVSGDGFSSRCGTCGGTQT
jgi:hypothetical protein